MAYTKFKVVDTGLPADKEAEINSILAQACLLQFDSLYNQQIGSYGPGGSGDPRNGTTVTGTTPPLRWEDTSEPQGMIFDAYQAIGMTIPANMQEIMTANEGPNEPPYFSYAEWGLVGGEGMDPRLKTGTVLHNDGERATAYTGILRP